MFYHYNFNKLIIKFYYYKTLKLRKVIRFINVIVIVIVIKIYQFFNDCCYYSYLEMYFDDQNIVNFKKKNLYFLLQTLINQYKWEEIYYICFFVKYI